MDEVTVSGNTGDSGADPSKAKNKGKVGRPVGRPSRSLDEEISVTEAKLKALRDRRREEERRERERNLKSVLALIKDEGLDGVSADQWKASMPKLRELLGVASSASAKS